jgi:hypothetical protein
MKFTLLNSAFATAMLATALPSFAQMPAPAMVATVRIEVKRDRIPEFEEVEKQVTASYKKAAPTDQFRVVLPRGRRQHRRILGADTVVQVRRPGRRQSLR